ncbi:MAG TPA: anti-sigma factor [Bryobacteraceae bacterium]|nr:anti-sigma factor [Bryobacteraceae bacterium]
MKCDELLPSYLLYATGKMQEPELSELRAHLARGCEDCTAGVRAARAVAYSMGAVLEGQDPSPQLRARVLAIPDAPPEPRSRPVVTRKRPFWLNPMPVWMGLALACACVVLVLIPAFVWRQQLSDSQAAQSEIARTLTHEQSSTASLRQQIAKLESTGPNGQPQGVPIFPLELARGAGSPNEVQNLTLLPGVRAVVLALPIDLVQQASAADLVNSSNQNILTASPLLTGNSESAGLTIPAERLPAGRYAVVLRAGERTIARLPFRVTIANPPGA